MLNKIPQTTSSLVPNSANPIDVVNCINKYINDIFCENFTVDISFMNVMDACYVTTLCSTKHYIKYPAGKIVWKVSSLEVEKMNKDLQLGNSYYTL